MRLSLLKANSSKRGANPPPVRAHAAQERIVGPWNPVPVGLREASAEGGLPICRRVPGFRQPRGRARAQRFTGIVNVLRGLSSGRLMGSVKVRVSAVEDGF